MLDPNTADGIELMLKRTGGVRIELGDDETWGHYEVTDELQTLESDLSVGEPFLLIATGKLPALEIDAELIVERDGELEAWYARDFRRIEDGKMTRIPISKER